MRGRNEMFFGAETKKEAIPLAILAAVTVVSKLPILNTPAFWDEMGWYEQAAWLSRQNLIKAMPGFRDPAEFFGHPTGLHLVFAATAKAAGGASLPLAHLMIALFAALGVCATYLLARRSSGRAVAWTAALLLLLSPVYFAQSGMFLADLPVAALGTFATYLALSGRFKAYLICAACMTLLKETAAAIVLAIAIYKFLDTRRAGDKSIRDLVLYASPLAAIATFILVQRIETGHFLWIYSFDVKFIQPGLMSPIIAFGRVVAWIMLQQGRVVFTALIAVNLVRNRAARQSKELRLLLLIFFFFALPFSVIYYLPRYVTPVLPLFFIVAAKSFSDLTGKRRPRLAYIGALVAFAAMVTLMQPMWGNGETSLRYREVVAVNKSAADMISRKYPGATVAAAFPANTALVNPMLGYVDRPFAVKAFEHASDIAGATVIVATSPTSLGADSLRLIATRDPWRRVGRFESSGAWAEVYVK